MACWQYLRGSLFIIHCDTYCGAPWTQWNITCDTFSSTSSTSLRSARTRSSRTKPALNCPESFNHFAKSPTAAAILRLVTYRIVSLLVAVGPHYTQPRENRACRRWKPWQDVQHLVMYPWSAWSRWYWILCNVHWCLWWKLRRAHWCSTVERKKGV